jgi:hypothetical protein
MNLTYWLLFFVRAILLGVIIHDYGWKAALLAFAYTTATVISEVCA